ncbi:MAG: hypothetical protein IJY27_05785 [Clostridia bacterium]|nr:hypothetical protein [Clostridia bacterium]
MFQIKKPEYVNKTFRIPLDLINKLEFIAQEKQISLNNLVVQCCDYALENLQSGIADSDADNK